MDPDLLAQQCADLMWARDRASQALGVEIDGIRPGVATAAMTVGPDMVNGHDIAHGGYVFTLADTAFAFACNTYGVVTVAAGADILFVAPARLGDRLVAQAHERSRSGRNGVYDVTVRTAAGELIAEFRGRSRATSTPIAEG